MSSIEPYGSELPIVANEEGIQDNLEFRGYKNDSSSYDDDFSEESTRDFQEKSIVIPNKRVSNKKKRKKSPESSELSQLKFIATQVFFIFVIHAAKALTDKVVGGGRTTAGDAGHFESMMDVPQYGGSRLPYQYSSMNHPSIMPRKLNPPLPNYISRRDNPMFFGKPDIPKSNAEVASRKEVLHYTGDRDIPSRRHEPHDVNNSVPGNFSNWEGNGEMRNNRFR